jgi:hypothetical protein
MTNTNYDIKFITGNTKAHSFYINNKNMKQMASIFKNVVGGFALAMLISFGCMAQTLNDIQGSFNNYRHGALHEIRAPISPVRYYGLKFMLLMAAIINR